MRRLIALVVLGLLLFLAVGVLFGLGRSGLHAEARRMVAESHADQRRMLEAVRTEVGHALTKVLERETTRPYYQYRALYVPPDLVANQIAFVPSPLAEAPEDPLVRGYFEYRDKALSSPSLFVPDDQAPQQAARSKAPQDQKQVQTMTPPRTESRNAQVMRPLLKQLDSYGSNLDDALNAPPQEVPTQTAEIDTYLALANGTAQGYLYGELGQQGGVSQKKLQREWQKSQRRVGKTPGQYGEPQTSAAPVKVELFPFRTLALGTTARGWPQHLLAVRRVRVGKETWLQGFAFDLARLRDRLLPSIAAQQPALVVETPVSSLEEYTTSESPQSVAQTLAGSDVRVLPVAEAEQSGREHLRLLTPLHDLAVVYTGASVDPEAALAGSRLLLRGALGLAVCVFLLGSSILVLAARGERKLAQQRSDFVAALTHELKAPLTGVRALAELLHEGLVTDEAKRQEYYGAMLAESERLSRLVQNVLDAAKMERGALEVVCEPLDVGPILAELAGRFRPRLEAEGQTLTLDLGVDDAVVLADREAVTQVVANLLDNAGKYGGQGEVRLETRLLGEGRLAIQVSDTGPGIPAQEREQVFAKFFRSPSAPRQIGGAGLGLAIARALTRAQGGDLVADASPSGGALFRLTLPTC